MATPPLPLEDPSGSKTRSRSRIKNREEIEDTRDWGWDRWSSFFLHKDLLREQVELLELMDKYMVLLNYPRQHGKTSYIVEVFITRKLCESVFYDHDRPILYVTHSNRPNAVNMTLAVRDNLFNEAIVAHYGELIDYGTVRGRNARDTQTQYEINLLTKKDRQLKSFRATSAGSRIRGGNAYYTIIDDPVDIQEEVTDLLEQTKKFMAWFNRKVVPLAKGTISVIGTRYHPEDIYMELKDTKLFKFYSKKAILSAIPSYTLPQREVLPDGSLAPILAKDIIISHEAELLHPELWNYQEGNILRCGNATQNILLKHHLIGEIAFQQEFQNNPTIIESVVKWEWFHKNAVLPERGRMLQWVCFQDTSSGESSTADYNAFVLVGKYRQNYYIKDVLFGRWTPLNRVKAIEEFILKNATELHIDPVAIRFLMEVVRTSGSDFFQLVREHSWLTPKKVNPKGRGDKDFRITTNLGGEAEAGRVYILSSCRNTQQFAREVRGFPHGKHEHIMDAADQAIYILKMRKSSLPKPVTF